MAKKNNTLLKIVGATVGTAVATIAVAYVIGKLAGHEERKEEEVKLIKLEKEETPEPVGVQKEPEEKPALKEMELPAPEVKEPTLEEEIEDAVDEAEQKVEEIKEEISQQTEEAVEKVEEAVAEAVESVKEAVEEIVPEPKEEKQEEAQPEQPAEEVKEEAEEVKEEPKEEEPVKAEEEPAEQPDDVAYPHVSEKKAYQIRRQIGAMLEKLDTAEYIKLRHIVAFKDEEKAGEYSDLKSAQGYIVTVDKDSPLEVNVEKESAVKQDVLERACLGMAEEAAVYKGSYKGWAVVR